MKFIATVIACLHVTAQAFVVRQGDLSRISLLQMSDQEPQTGISGKVKFFSDKGFGFIASEDGGKIVFVHHAALNDAQRLRKDAEVQCKLVFDEVKQKYKSENVTTEIA